MTGTEILADTRALIQEASAKYFTDAQLYIFLNNALKKWVAVINKSNNMYYFDTATITHEVASRTISLPSDATGTIFGIEASDGSGIYFKPFNEFYQADEGEASWYSLMGMTLFLNTLASIEKDYTLYHMKLPTAIATGDTVVDFPILHHELLSYEAAIKASIRRKDEHSDLIREREMLIRNLKEDLGNQVVGEPMSIPDHSAIYAGGDD